MEIVREISFTQGEICLENLMLTNMWEIFANQLGLLNYAFLA